MGGAGPQGRRVVLSSEVNSLVISFGIVLDLSLYFVLIGLTLSCAW